MTSSAAKQPSDKPNLHPRNPHRFQYDFKALIKSCPELAAYVFINPYKNQTIDFANPNAVKSLNKAILRHFYKINYWDIPDGYLCPPIPGRADYIHYLADLLKDTKLPINKNVRGLDIGTGANCVYPIIGHQSYDWTFVGTDSDATALQSAQKIVSSNANLTPFIELRRQTSPSHIFKGIVLPGEHFDFTMCNPPFHASQAEALAGTKRKWQNLGQGKAQKQETLNFGGQQAELWYPGGEKAFLTKMINESASIPTQCTWFTSLVSKKATLPPLYKLLNSTAATDVKTIEMSQGQKTSRILAWTFLK